jgi:hypothetical protein
MGLGTNNTTVTTADKYIPELWSMEVIAAYKANNAMRSRVTLFNHNKKKGDTIHVPNFTRSLASAKAAGTQVTLVAPTHSETTVSLNKHFEYSILIEDIVAVQALDTLRQAHTDDAGYSLARQVDFNLHVLGTGFQGGTLDATPGTPDANTLTYGTGAVIGSDGSTAWSPTANTNTGNGSNLTDAGIRHIFRLMDDNNLPMSDRTIVIPPCQKEVLLGIPRFTEQAFNGDGSAISTGQIGNIYGNPVYVSTNCGNTLATDASTAYRAVLFFHKSSIALAEQMSVRTQSQYKQEYLADLFTADTIYGVAELRDNGGYSVIVPA